MFRLCRDNEEIRCISIVYGRRIYPLLPILLFRLVKRVEGILMMAGEKIEYMHN